MPGVPDDPADMTPFQRHREIAAILARGVLRAREFASTSADSHDTSPTTGPDEADSRQTCLDPAQEVALMNQPVNGTGERNEAI